MSKPTLSLKSMASQHPCSSKTSKSDTTDGEAQDSKNPPANVPSDKEVMMGHGFYLGKKLGSGSYSKVRFAVTKYHFEKVAVKIIDLRRAPQDYKQAFLPRELRIITRLIHPNLLRTYDWFQDGEKIYQILELAERGDVLDHVRTKSKGAVGEELAKKWVLQTARALGCMYSRAIAHRDIKCENLMLDARMDIKLGDFGFARHIGFCHLSRTYCGSAAYAAPEIIRSQPYSPYMSDVWALGVVTYILMTGYMPFGDDVRNVAKILAAQQRELVYPSIETKISDECKAIIKDMLTVDVGSRKDINMIMVHPWFESVRSMSTPFPSRISIDDAPFVH